MASFLPEFDLLAQDGQQFQFKAQINADLLAFKGHFPEFAVFPGVAQIAMVRELVAKHMQHLGEMYKAEQLRFQNFVLPNQELFIALECNQETVTFKISNAQQQSVASGRLLFKV